MLTAIDLFSGAGGLSLGLKAASFRTVLAVERSADAVATYRQNVGADAVIEGDIRNVDFTRFSGVDLVAGGPPCQPFSTGGLRKGAEDARDLLSEFVRAVIELAPRMFMLENVPGLASEYHAEYMREALAPLFGAYRISGPHLVNSAHYGVPQGRRRMLLVGCRDRDFVFPLGNKSNVVTAGSVISSSPNGEPNLSIVTYAKNPDLRPSPYHGHMFNGGGRPLNLHLPAPTILASAGGNKTHWIDIDNRVPPYHHHLMSGGRPRNGILSGARRLTVAESAALQTFPAKMIFSGQRSSQYTQVGNAVPVLLAKAVGEAMAEHLHLLKSRKRTKRSTGQPVPV